MRFADLLSLSSRNYRTKLGRTLITILGIGVGVGTIVLLVSFGYGLQNLLMAQISTSESLRTIDIYSPDAETIFLDNSLIDKMSKLENVTEVSPIANFMGQAALSDLNANVTIYGIKPLFFTLEGIKPPVGQLPQNSKEVVCSTAFVKLFNLTPEQIINKTVDVNIFQETASADQELPAVAEYQEKGFKIVGVIEDETVPTVYLFLDDIKDVPIVNYQQLKVMVSKTDFVETVRQQAVDFGYLTSSLSDTVSEANKIFKTIQIMLAIFGMAALLVAAIGMFNTMTITLLERTNEIGVMKAIGASNREISALFLLEATIMGFLGSIAGLLMGWLSGKILNFVLHIMAMAYSAQSVNVFYIPVWFMLTVIISTTIVGFSTAIYPAQRAGKYDPLEALRYK
ncbi:MAG: FtsX-like permease family protein [Patescibacteria group bacterium]|jgi:ABC-type antimicrobial peptide transport system permease subunit